jgi:hypothetical protein
MRKIILTSAVLVTAALGASTFALADKSHDGDRSARFTSMCTDRTAKTTGHLSYLEAKLKPTAAQTKAWDAYKDAVTTQAKSAEAACLDRAANMKQKTKDHKRPSIVERQARMEKGLEAKLAGLKATQPALTTLYASLTEDQQQMLNRYGDMHRKHSAERHGRKHHGGMDHKAGFERHHDHKDAPDAAVEQ